MTLTRRGFVPAAVLALAASLWPRAASAAMRAARGWSAANDPAELERLRKWVAVLRAETLVARGRPIGAAVARVGELALGSPYAAGTLDAYAAAPGAVDLGRDEPLTLSLQRFDCVTLVESCVAVARLARRRGAPSWKGFGREIATLRYRGGQPGPYPSRLHYFSDWIGDNVRRGTMRSLGRELGGVADPRPLRFMTAHRASYPALASEAAFAAIARHEKRLDDARRRVIPVERLDALAPKFRSGDILAFATTIEGLDVTHTGLAWRDPAGVLRVLHAPLSGGVVQTSPGTLREYVAGLKRSTGVLAARPLPD